MPTWGIMGGSFDPIHNGHLQMAADARDQLALAGVLFIPVGDPPHKSQLAPAMDRLHMVELAIEGHDGFLACDIEIRRKQTTYTIDTLTQLRQDHPQNEYTYIVGADTLMVIESWRTFERVAPLLKSVACALRQGTDLGQVQAQMRHLWERYCLKVELLRRPGPDISSTEIRQAVARSLPLPDLLPARVEAYINQHALYSDPMLDLLHRTLTADRYRHTLGVERTAIQLAQAHGLDPAKARIAALLHDCAKCMPEAKMAQLLDRHGQLPENERDQTRTLMHASAGAILAKSRYSVTDPDILGAIRWHTTGRAGMSALEKLVYLADVIEPNRHPFPALDAIRKATWRNLDEGMRLAATRTLEYLNKRDVQPDPNTLQLLKEYQSHKDNGG